MADHNQDKNIFKNQPQNIRDQVALLSFIENLIKEKNDPIKPEALPQVKVAMLNELNEMINTRMVRLLDAPDQRELDILLKNKVSDEELDKFFENKIPNLTVELASVLIDFRVAYLLPLPSDKKSETPPPPPAPVIS
ncbi:hypothetical protein COV87_00295 [Candidatus Roizmanbacteria bacterium CG11_big_fil_rev_8_21_14_0_20_37_16]|uniref:Uncharacterized protein n=1 Tax=Candidatus Roizmanbacteria bacterium CG11_big_fil_rev_8_21_14_0_20_37_16 TaxID=1974857 RepID=A0A2H0KL51_9BACT|nr:MAG: hypothetical protein COV87_00295 [Candidatus Roizmanbacteria bacterium CG11_big_fil_rev_8_21_14_0_20_37_16]